MHEAHPVVSTSRQRVARRPFLRAVDGAGSFALARLRAAGRAALTLSSVLWGLGCSMPTGERVTIAGHAGECVQCHRDEWSSTRSPQHAQARLGQRCADCHATSEWTPARGYEHLPSFPLTSGHSGVACTSCHVRGYEPGETSDACVGCHAADAADVSDPIHAGLTTDCFACHRTDGFWPAHFVHSWPLQGKHMLTSCRSCHARGDAGAVSYEQAPSACLSCHARDKQRADSAVPGHPQYSSDCAQCHDFEKF